jgi:hypothetical protein
VRQGLVRTGQLKKLTRSFLVEQDSLGLKNETAGSIMLGANSGSKLDAFANWFKFACVQTILGKDASWIAPFIRAGYEKGANDAARRIKAEPVIDEDKFAAFESVNAHELDGIADAVEQQAVRAVGEGLRMQRTPQQILTAVLDRIEKIGETRIKALAHFSVVSAHASASLATYRQNNLTKVGVQAERVPRVRRAGIAIGTSLKHRATRKAEGRRRRGPSNHAVRKFMSNLL